LNFGFPDPQGGDNVSVTKGIVSRVIVGCYSHSGESLLSIQIDAAINSGNSGLADIYFLGLIQFVYCAFLENHQICMLTSVLYDNCNQYA